MKSLYIQNDIDGIRKGLDFIESTLISYKVKQKFVQEALMLTEEALVKILDVAKKGAEIRISKRLETAKITLISSGSQVELFNEGALGINIQTNDSNAETESMLRDAVLTAYEKKISYKFKSGTNIVNITAGLPLQKSIIETAIGIGLGFVLGMLMRYILPQSYINILQDKVLYPIEKLFLNALQATVIPVMFFAIVCVIAKFIDFSESSKVGAKIISWYLFTAIIAVLISLGVVSIFKPGVAGLGKELFNYTFDATKTSGNISILEQLYSLVPNNIFKAFLTDNTIQVVFMAMICGIALGALTDYRSRLNNFFNTGYALFAQITSIIEKAIPYIVFVCSFSIIIQTGTKTLYSLALYIFTMIIGVICLMLVYSIIVAVFVKKSPIWFLRKAIPLWKNLFKMGSDGESITYLIKESKKQFGIKTKVPTLILTIGNTLNMDTSCLYLGVAGLFLARFYGIHLFGSSIFSIVVSIVILSIGCPNGLGANIIAMTLLVVQLGMPIESIVIILGLDAVLSIIFSCTNAIGDLANSIVVSNTEGFTTDEMLEEK